MDTSMKAACDAVRFGLKYLTPSGEWKKSEGMVVLSYIKQQGSYFLVWGEASAAGVANVSDYMSKWMVDYGEK